MNCNCTNDGFGPNDFGIIGDIQTLAKYKAVNENGVIFPSVETALMNAKDDNEVAEISAAYDNVYRAQIGNFVAVINVISSVLGIITGKKSNSCPQCPPIQMTTNYLPLVAAGGIGLILSLIVLKK